MRLAGNEIELGIEIPTIKSRASNMPIDKGNYICFPKGSTSSATSQTHMLRDPTHAIYEG